MDPFLSSAVGKETPSLLGPLERLNKKKTLALSPEANYIDWATATCRRNLVPTFVDNWFERPNTRGVSYSLPEVDKEPVSETSCFLVFRIAGVGQSPKTSDSKYYAPATKPIRVYTGSTSIAPRNQICCYWFRQTFSLLSTGITCGFV
jgi:hypothetical protein